MSTEQKDTAAAGLADAIPGKEKPKVPAMLTQQRLGFVIARNRTMADRAERVIKHLQEHPEIDEDLAALFNITSPNV